MPHTRSAKKNLRKSEKRRLHNRGVKKSVRKELKATLVAVEGTVEDLDKQVRVAIMKLDRAASKRIIHPNQAARKKSQLAKLLNKQKAKTAPAGS